MKKISYSLEIEFVKITRSSVEAYAHLICNGEKLGNRIGPLSLDEGNTLTIRDFFKFELP